MLRRRLEQRPSILIFALAAASLGLFLLVANLAEPPHEGRFVTEFALISPLVLYIAAGFRKLVR